MEPYAIALTVLGGTLVFLFFAAVAFAYRQAFYSNRKKTRDPYRTLDLVKGFEVAREDCRKKIDRLYSLPSEKIEITSRDGLKLSARFYKGKNGAPYHLMFHGYKSTPFLDLLGGGVEFTNKGHNVILVDQRAHGDSEGKTITFGVLESYDALDWIKYTVERFGEDIEIILFGVSMGAATVLSALEFPLHPSVRGVIADSPFSSPMEIMQSVAKKMHVPPRVSTFLLRPAALIFGRFRLGRRSAKNAVKNAGVPVLLIHGDDDSFVPRYMSDEIYKSARSAGRDIRYLVFPGADHVMSYLTDMERYIREVNIFLKYALDKKNT